MRDRYIQIADNNTLGAGAAAAPIYQYLHDGFDHGTFGIRRAGFKVFSSTGAAGLPQASGELVNGVDAQNMTFLEVGDVIYARAAQNSKNPAGGQKNLWLARTIITAAADAPEMHANADFTDVDLYYRKLKTGDASDKDCWIGCQNAQEIGLQVFCHSAGPVDVYIESSIHPNAPDDTPSGDLPTELQIVTVQDATGEYIRIQGPKARIRVGFKGSSCVVSAGLLFRRDE